MGTESYGYTNTSWLDRLTSYNGTTITYDNIGNPLSYNNGASYSFTWKNGRELASVVKGGVTTSYKYGADGLRIQKTYGSTTYNYYYSDGNLVRQTWGTHYIDFLYDETGTAYSFVYDGTQYYYVKNLQGDVTQIRSIYGTVVVEYSYDAWGNVLSVSGMYANTLGQDNPIRYRGYYYDFETGFYYLQSRYYDPVMRRFINADGYVNANGDMLGFNLYAYCSNNPVIYSDYNGQFAIAILGAALAKAATAALGSAVIGVAVISVVSSAQSNSAITFPPIALPPISFPEFRKKEIAVPIPKVQEKDIVPSKNSNAVYYGCGIDNYGELKKLTGPMNFDTAYKWAITSKSFGHRTIWGLYTENSYDAFLMASSLGVLPEPILHDKIYKKGYYSHFHTNPHDFMGIYKDFHVWFGNPYAG